MHRYQRIFLILFCIAIVWASIWVPLSGKAINMREIEITSYHWIWNTDRIYWRGLMAIPSHIDYGRLILSYIAIISLFGGVYSCLGLVLRRKMNATQSEIEDKISSENMKCPKCKVAPLVGVDGKRQEVFLLCPKCETEWYLHQDPIGQMTSTLIQCLTENDRFPIHSRAIKAKIVRVKKKSITDNPKEALPISELKDAECSVRKESDAKQNIVQKIDAFSDENRTCPKCGRSLNYKNEGTGAYWHCDYPRCSFVEVVKKQQI